MIKFLFGALFSVICLAVALLPEISMYFLYHAISPTTELGQIAMVALFVLGGGGMCVLFGFIGFALWASLMKVLLE